MRKILDERGSSIVVAVMTGIFLSIIGYATVSTVIIDSQMGVANYQATQALWLAESGIELAYRWLRYEDPPPGGTVPFVKYNQVAAGAGTYKVTINPDNNNLNTYLKKYKILSEGSVDDVIRKIEIEVETTTFNKFAYLTGDEGGTIWFNTGDVIEGALHSNDRISIVGTPTFMGKVTSTATTFNKGNPYNPDFQQGYQLGVPPAIFPTQQDIMDNYWSMNSNPPGLQIDARFGKKAKLKFKANGTLVYSVWHFQGGQKIYDIQDAVVNMSDLNGMIYVQGSISVKGKVDGQVSLIATKNIKITNDLVYETSDANGKPPSSSDDVLGLISMKDTIIADNQANGNDVIINAAILTLGDSFRVQNYDSGSPRGQLTIWGSLSQKVRGPVGTFSWWGSTGYQKDYHYDNRFISTAPPYFPTTGQYNFTYWKEITD